MVVGVCMIIGDTQRGYISYGIAFRHDPSWWLMRLQEVDALNKYRMLYLFG
jgi:hypothetical protein